MNTSSDALGSDICCPDKKNTSPRLDLNALVITRHPARRHTDARKNASFDSSGATNSYNAVTQSSLISAVMSLFWPALMSLASSALIGIVDISLAGRLGSVAQAAVGIADQVLFLVTMAGAGLATACVAHVSKHKGANEKRLTLLYARDSVFLAIMAGMAASVVCFAFCKPLIALFHCSPEIAAKAVEYSMWNAPANAAYLTALCLVAVFRALGRPRIGLAVWLIMSTVSNGLSVVFFECGHASLHSLAGLGLAWDIGSFSGTSLGLVMFFSVDRELRTAMLSDLTSSYARMCDLLKTAAPAVTAELAPIVANFAVYRMLSELSCAGGAQAAWTIRMKLEETFATMPLAALAMAIAVVVGQNIGAGLYRRARRCAVYGCLAGAAAMLPVGVILSLQSGSIVTGFSHEGTTNTLAVTLLEPFYLILPALGLSQILCGALDGAALTKIPMSISLIGLVFVRCGLAFLFIQAGQGVSGLANATLISSISLAALSVSGFALFYRTGAFSRHAPVEAIAEVKVSQRGNLA